MLIHGRTTIFDWLDTAILRRRAFLVYHDRERSIIEKNGTTLVLQRFSAFRDTPVVNACRERSSVSVVDPRGRWCWCGRRRPSFPIVWQWTTINRRTSVSFLKHRSSLPFPFAIFKV